MKKILYFLPFVLWSALYFHIGIVDSFIRLNPIIWVWLAMLLTSGIFMLNNKWWGCIFGILFGLYLIILGIMSLGHPAKFINEMPFGIMLCIYYGYFGMDLYKINNNYI